ncbi:MAG TPA: translation initiation factor IF-2 [Ignavibacteriaceae bacterium]|nr:translation initiation factor IF-2 [Ignavibacteriaceae bacterium]
MADTKEKKTRIYKLATEYNLSADSLVEFLNSKGFKVKNHMSLLEDDMIAAINAHYKKDIEKAEHHYKKLAEFHQKRAERAIKDAKEEGKEVEVKEVLPAAESVEPESIIKATEKAVEEAAQIESEKQVQQPVGEKAAESVESALEIKADKEKEGRIPKAKGLKVIGRMDLDEKKKEEPVKTVGTKPEGEKEEAAKKKRKPRIRKKKAAGVVEDTPEAKKKKRVRRFEVDEREVKEAIRKTLMSMDDASAPGRASARKRKRKEREALEEKRLEEKSIAGKLLRVNEYISVSELANLMNVPVSDVITKCIELGLMVSINQRLDVETITLVADEFEFDIELQEEYTSDAVEDSEDGVEELQSRSPVVTIMGHVDHGKTSLLDYIRRTNVVAGESGGITQHIGAYKVILDNGRSITFLDTPGHEAFTAMRARGAQLTDIVVLVVAADDAVMPQTIEAINHAQAAGVPIIVAINKMDKPGANPERLKQQLADRNILVEEWGGKYQSVEISAKLGTKVEHLLEKIILEAEILDLKANPERLARGVVVESELDKGKGIKGTILVQKGTLKIGDPFIAGIYQGKVRAMFDERGNKVVEAPPATPVLVLGFEGPPQAGDSFVVVESERVARDIGIKRQQLKREQDQKQIHHLTLDEVAQQISIGGVKELPLIVKGDVDGSVEALADSLLKLSTEEVKINVIHKGVGGISESDVLLADASRAIIIGFHVRPNLNARKLAEKQLVDIRLYSVIYNAINEVKSALEGLLSPIISEEVTATLEVRDIFKVPKFGTVAGCYVLEGKISRSNKIRLIREGIVIYEGDIGTLKRFKDDVREVDAGYECGLNIANYNDVKVSDIIESYKLIETKKTLS